eukprot:g1975.t1
MVNHVHEAEELRSVLEERALRRQLTGNARTQDVVTLDVGGKIYTVKRETLCLCRGSFLAELFSGRWDSALPWDKAGHLEISSAAGRCSPAMPKVPPEQLQDFQVAVDFLGLRSYLDVEGFGRDGWASELSKEETGEDEEPPPRAATGAASPERSFLKAAGAFLAPWRGAETQASEVPAHVAPALGAGVEPVEPPAEPPKVVGWSRKGSDPAVQHEEATICCMPDTRALRKSCAARATRGYQSGTHRFGVLLGW